MRQARHYRIDWGAYPVSFGKYRGKPVDQVPEHYLSWILEKMRQNQPGLCYAIRKYFGARK